MTLQDLFYMVGLFYMTMCIVLMVALVIAVFFIKKKVVDLERTFEEKIDLVKNIASHPAESAVDMGASLAETIIEKIKSGMEGKKTKKN